MPLYRAMGYNSVEAQTPTEAALAFAKRTALKCGGKDTNVKLVKTTQITKTKTRVVIDITINDDITQYTFNVEPFTPKKSPKKNIK